MPEDTEPPIFSAVSPSARQLHQLLRCISFANKVQVRITSEGLRFSASETSVLQASINLSKDLFSSYTYTSSTSTTFEISLPALLETLQIFSLSDPSTKPDSSLTTFAAHRLNRHNTPFLSSVLGTSGLCRLLYSSQGSPLSIQLSEAGIRTSCDLTTYISPTSSTNAHNGDTNSNDDDNDDDNEDDEATDEAETDIPFDRTTILLKTILRSTHLADAINELHTTTPSTLLLTAIPRPPTLTLLGTGGALGTAQIDFSGKDSDGGVLETFDCRARWSGRYSFETVRKAARAMATASKVSVRADGAGVLSLQFLVEVEGMVDRPAFVDFRVVPLAGEDGEDEEGSD